MFEQEEDRDIADVESALASLVPAPSRVERDSLMFRAGQLSARPHGRFWPFATAAMAVVAVILGAGLALRPEPPAVDRVVYVPIERPQPAALAAAVVETMAAEAELLSRGSYLTIRQKVLEEGLDALPAPEPRAAAVEPESLEDLLNGIGMPRKPTVFGLANFISVRGERT